MNYFPLRVFTHYSILSAIPQPEQVAGRIVELDMEGCAITDIDNISGAVEFSKEMEEVGKKSIIGCHYAGVTLLAKNKRGWKQLIKLTSLEHTIGSVLKHSKHLICLCPLLKHQLIQFDEIAHGLKDVFGDDFYIEIPFEDTPLFEQTREKSREIAKKVGALCVATPNPHYLRHEDVDDHHIILCKRYRTTLANIENVMEPKFVRFFSSDKYHLPTYEEMAPYYKKEELSVTFEIAKKCGSYSVLEKPILSDYSTPDKSTPDDYLRHLCREGWKKKIGGKIPKAQHQVYGDRVKMELEVLQGAGLSSYFLIVKDIVDFIKSKGWLVGAARGSAAGCLVSYLTDITAVNPIPHKLIFERFYNAGRNTKEKVSYPDIDIDVPTEHRDAIIQYVKEKYGKRNVAQMLAYQTLKGRGALKAVFKALGGVTFQEINRITDILPQEAKITAELQEMKEENEVPSIILAALKNKTQAQKLREWAYLEKGVIKGPLSRRFEQAIRLEGTKIAPSVHPAGIIISPKPLDEVCPMAVDPKTGEMIAGLEMNAVEDIGLIKFDILGIAFLDKVALATKLIRRDKC